MKPWLRVVPTYKQMIISDMGKTVADWLLLTYKGIRLSWQCNQSVRLCRTCTVGRHDCAFWVASRQKLKRVWQQLRREDPNARVTSALGRYMYCVHTAMLRRNQLPLLNYTL